MVHVSAAIIRNENGDILACKRGPGGVCAYLWEFPGGKQEPGESEEECLLRECEEELGVTLIIEDVFARTVHAYPDRKIAFTFYNARIKEGTPTLIVHEQLRWMPAQDMREEEFCPADDVIIQDLKRDIRQRI